MLLLLKQYNISLTLLSSMLYKTPPARDKNTPFGRWLQIGLSGPAKATELFGQARLPDRDHLNSPLQYVLWIVQ
jgi:hypothetical protein